MSGYIPTPRVSNFVHTAALAGVLLLLLYPVPAAAQESQASGMLPSPAPFTLNIYDAMMAASMLERVGFVQIREGKGEVRTVAVESVRIVRAGTDARYPEPHDRRYDILLGGTELEWNRTYIEYDFRMVNMRLLFTYRNQRPVPDVPYYLNPAEH
jgi:hypothetical protein